MSVKRASTATALKNKGGGQGGGQGSAEFLLPCQATFVQFFMNFFFLTKDLSLYCIHVWYLIMYDICQKHTGRLCWISDKIGEILRA